jgi:hypothetical protein
MSDQPVSSFHVDPYSAQGVVANTTSAHVRTQPVIDPSTIITDLSSGTKVTITGTVKLATGQYQDWYQIIFSGILNGASSLQTFTAFIIKPYLNEVPAATTTTPVAASTNASQTTTDSTTPATTSSTDILLTVPWFSQLYPDPPHFEACGPTSVLEILKAYGVGKLKTLQDWVTMQYMSSLANTTGSQTLINLAKAAGPLPLTAVTPAPAPAALLDTLRGLLAKRLPVILLVDYVKLKAATPFNKTTYINTSASVVDHWWVVVGTEGSNFIVNDSLWKPGDNGGRGGFNLRVPGPVLQSAYHDSLLLLTPANPLP